MQIAALFRLDGRTAIVTGGASRFGSPISRALAQAGANVMIASRRLQPCEELALELREEGLSAHALQVDLADDDSIRQLAQACACLLYTSFPFLKIPAASLKHQTFTVLHFLKVLCRNFLYHLFSLPCFL